MKSIRLILLLALLGCSHDAKRENPLDPELTPIDTVLFGPQTADISQGRSPDSSDMFEWFADPTPGRGNSQ